jgi:adenine specific DNA methylase Mod
VLDPFSGSGTVCKVAKARARHFIGFEISPLYHQESVQRLSLQARGELLSILSEILKEHVFGAGGTKKFSAIEDKVMNLLSPFSLKPYEDIITKPYLTRIFHRIF